MKNGQVEKGFTDMGGDTTEQKKMGYEKNMGQWNQNNYKQKGLNKSRSQNNGQK